MEYCCKEMKFADKKGIIDYAPGHLTTIDTKTEACPIHFCPFCSKELKGTGKSIKRIKKYFGKKRGGMRR